MTREARVWTLVGALMAGIALWIDLGPLHAFQHADSLIPVLVSTQRWTPFFWGQDRFGMLVPLLAMPVRAPLANLLLQGWTMTVAALMAPFLIARFLAERPEEWISVGALTNLLLVSVTAPITQFDWFVVQPYALSIALGFAGLLVADRAGTPAAVVALFALVLAHWVNVGVVVLLAVAIVARSRHPVRRGTLVLIAAAVAAWMTRWLPHVHTPAALSSPAQWVIGWRALLASATLLIAHPVAFAAIVAAATVSVATVTNRRTPRVLQAAAIPLAAAVVNWLAVGTSEWVRLNLYYPRYMFPSLLMAGVAAAVVLAAVAGERVAALPAPCCVALTVGLMAMYGRPSVARVSESIDARFGRMTPAVVTSGAAAIAGDYWTVWPAVFHANLALSRAATPRRVFGLTYRSEVTDPIWCAPAAPFIVAGASDDPSVVSVAARHDVVLTLLEHNPPVDLFHGRAMSDRKPPL